MTKLAPDLAHSEHALVTFLQERACMFRGAEREKIVNGYSGDVVTFGNLLLLLGVTVNEPLPASSRGPHRPG
jgi:hypothetical protein